MRTAIPISLGPLHAEADDLRFLVEVDRRRSSIGLHVASDLTRAARTSSSLWLDPDRAERLAQEILSAVAAWREHEASVAWTATTSAGGHA